jgi:hypothetical protein
VISVAKALLKRERKKQRREKKLRRAALQRRRITTQTLIIRRAIELFRNSNQFLRLVEPAEPPVGSTIRIRLPATYTMKTEP